MRVIHYPDYSRRNPYQYLMFKGLQAHGISILAFRGTTRSLFTKVFKEHVDVVHLHWISMPVTTGTLLHALCSMGLFYVTLLLWRLKGTQIVWTVHNLVNHDLYRVRLDALNARIVAALVHRVLVHGPSAVALTAERLGIAETKLSVTYHGNYSGAICAAPLDADHEERRFLFAGRIEAYKGITALLEAFRRLSGPHTLHIAGQVSDPGLKREVESLGAMDARITLDLTFISDEELNRLLAWCDVVALPYRDIFTSGSLLMALTAGRTIVAPNLGLLQDYLNDDVAFFYDPAREDALFHALERIVSATDLKTRSAKALARSEDFGWSKICAELVSIYRELAR